MTTDKEELRKEFNKWKYPQYEIPVNVFDWFYRKLEAKDKEIAELKQWKKEGLIVIGQWDKVSEYMNEYNLISLGENYSVVALKHLKQITDLKAEIERYKELILTFKNGLSMTYEQAKDQIAKKYDWRDWNELLYWHDKPENSFQKEDVDKYYTPEAAELYADSVARDAAINFADYLKDNRWRLSIETGNWERTFSHCDPEIKTTADLYTIFLEYQPK